jgi:hypothetical protein
MYRKSLKKGEKKDGGKRKTEEKNVGDSHRDKTWDTG